MKNLNKKKKSLKGMTLVEIIISLAIVSILTVILVGASGLIDKYIKSANTVNNTVATQLPVAESKDSAHAHKITTKKEDGTDDDYSAKITFSVGGSSPRTVVMKGKLYEAEDPDNVSDENIGGGLNMKYIDDVQFDSAS